MRSMVVVAVLPVERSHRVDEQEFYQLLDTGTRPRKTNEKPSMIVAEYLSNDEILGSSG